MQVKDRSTINAATSTTQTFDELILRCLEDDYFTYSTRDVQKDTVQTLSLSNRPRKSIEYYIRFRIRGAEVISD
jgi:hypothetical protein